MFTDAKTRSFEHAVAMSAMPALPERLDGPLSVTIRAAFPRTAELARVYKRDNALKHPQHGLWHVQKPDADNVAKSVLDGLKSFMDDKQVALLRVEKTYADMVLVDGEWRQRPAVVHVEIETL